MRDPRTEHADSAIAASERPPIATILIGDLRFPLVWNFIVIIILRASWSPVVSDPGRRG
jgi:hypothetical protein